MHEKEEIILPSAYSLESWDLSLYSYYQQQCNMNDDVPIACIIIYYISYVCSTCGVWYAFYNDIHHNNREHDSYSHTLYYFIDTYV